MRSAIQSGDYFMKRMRILLYNQVGHYPLEAMEDGIHPENLSEQIDYLIKQGFHIVGLDQAVSYIKGKEGLPEKSLSITFDGGFADAYTNVLPILERYRVKAAFFISPAFVGGTRMFHGHSLPCMSWDQVISLREKGMMIGHYGCSGKAFKKVPKRAVEEDILRSKPLFEKYLGTEPPYYAVYEGTPEAETVRLLKEHGYKAMFTKSPTKQRPSLYSISRIQSDDDDFNIFLVKISKTFLFFKDSRYWKYIRRYRLDRAFHNISEFYNKIKTEKAS